jgi:hypothetical protein
MFLFLMSVPYYFDYSSLVIDFEIRQYTPYSFVPFAQDCFNYLEPFVVHMNFSIVVLISVKNTIGTHEKMLTISGHKGNANQNHIKISFYSC